MTIRLVDIRAKVRRTLQDTSYVRWGKHELNHYINDSCEEFIRLTSLPYEEKTITVTADTSQYSVPSEIMEVKGAEWEDLDSGTYKDRRGLAVVTVSEMNRLAAENRLSEYEYGVNRSEVILFGKSSSPLKNDWRIKTSANPEHIVIDQLRPDVFLVYPIPSSAGRVTLTGILQPFVMSDIIPYSYEKKVDGTPTTKLITTSHLEYEETVAQVVDEDRDIVKINDYENITVNGEDYTDSKDFTYKDEVGISPVWSDAIMFGVMERAYLKEHDLRNVEKSEFFRSKKNMLVGESFSNDSMHSGSVHGGININRFVVRA